MMTEDMLKSYLNTLRLDLNFFKDSIKEVSQDKEELGTNFTIQATTLEELVEKQIVLPKNVEKFKSAYKDPEKQCCIFLVTEHGAQFVFVPFEIQQENTAGTDN